MLLVTQTNLCAMCRETTWDVNTRKCKIIHDHLGIWPPRSVFWPLIIHMPYTCKIYSSPPSSHYSISPKFRISSSKADPGSQVLFPYIQLHEYSASQFVDLWTKETSNLSPTHTTYNVGTAEDSQYRHSCLKRGKLRHKGLTGSQQLWNPARQLL